MNAPEKPKSLQDRFDGIIAAVFPPGSSEQARLTAKRKRDLESFFFAGAQSCHAMYLESGFMNQDEGTQLMAALDAEIAEKTGTNRMMDGAEGDRN